MSPEGTALTATATASAIPFPAEPVSGFHVQLSTAGEAYVMELSGQLDSKDPAQELQPELLALHDKLIAAKVRQVRIDVTQVKFMNSSAIKCFMTWFLKAERAKAPYAVEILYDPKRTWQYVSFTTMGRIAPNVLKTQVKAAE